VRLGGVQPAVEFGRGRLIAGADLGRLREVALRALAGNDDRSAAVCGSVLADLERAHLIRAAGLLLCRE